MLQFTLEFLALVDQSLHLYILHFLFGYLFHILDKLDYVLLNALYFELNILTSLVVDLSLAVQLAHFLLVLSYLSL